MNENKTSKYFKYAIGEIILVVIGILIALQINNWNDNRKNRVNETVFLEGILNDISQQKKLCEFQIKAESIRKNWCLKGIEIVNNPYIESKIDSLYNYIQQLQPRTTFAVFNPTYGELKSTGNLSLIRNKDLKSDIVLFYQNLEKRAQIITNNNNNIDDVFKVFVLSNSLRFYYDTKKKLQILWRHKPSQILRLSNNLSMRKNLALSNLNRAKDVMTEANQLELKIKNYLSIK